MTNGAGERVPEPPLRWDVVEEHLEDAAFFRAQWERALVDPEYAPAEVVEGPEERMLAHVDGLVLGGRRAADRLLLPALAGDDPDAAFVAALALLLSEDGALVPQVVQALAKAPPELAAAIGRAFQLADRSDHFTRLAPVLASGPAVPQAVALEVLAARGLDPRARLDPLLRTAGGPVRVAALRLARRFPERADPQLVERALGAADPAERDAALAAGLVLGLRPAWDACLAALARPGPGWAFPALAWGLSGEPDVAPLVAGLADPERRGDALFALGFTGRVAAADAVLPFLADEESGKLAGEALSAITGLVLEGTLAKAPEPWRPGAPDRDEPADPSADLPAPDAAAVARWWAEARQGLEPAARFLAGRPWGPGGVLEALASGPMRRRAAHALDLAVRSRGAFQLDPRALVRRQLAELAAARTSPPRFLPGTWAEVSRAAAARGAAPAAAAAQGPAAPRHGPPDALAIIGLGMASSIADGAVQACAAARAGIVRVTPLESAPVWDEDEANVLPATGHVSPHTSGEDGAARLASLTSIALEDLLPALAAERGARTGLFLALPTGYFLTQAEAWVPEVEPEEGEEPPPPAPPPDPGRAAFQRRELEARLVEAVVEQVPAAGPFAVRRLFFEGAPGLVDALAAAREALRAGALDRCVVGGVDSLAAPGTLSALATLGLLKGPEVATGIVPGEAAALVLVEPPERASRGRRAVLGYVVRHEARREVDHALAEAAFVGRALAGAISAALPPEGSPGLVIGDLDGTTVRAMDWGGALQRTKAIHGAAEWYPAIHFGAVGAATGAVAIVMSCRGFARRYAPPDVLVWLWGEEGGRGALRIVAP